MKHITYPEVEFVALDANDILTSSLYFGDDITDNEVFGDIQERAIELF